jgi:hypothetical protein
MVLVDLEAVRVGAELGLVEGDDHFAWRADRVARKLFLGSLQKTESSSPGHS